jgi:hypothetical protein
MLSAGDELSTERRRLADVCSMIGVVGRHVDDLIQFGPGNEPGWLIQLGIPAGWQIAHIADNAVEPSRIAVRGKQPDGGWDACETISVFRFTGVPPADAVRNNAACTLRDLGAADVTTQVLGTPLLPAAIAVRSNGYFGVAGLWIWAQYSTYVFGSNSPGRGRLIEHAVFVESACLRSLRDDIAQLTNAVHQAFMSTAAFH